MTKCVWHIPKFMHRTQSSKKTKSYLGTNGGLIPALGGSTAPPVKNLIGARNRVPSKSKIDSHLRVFFEAVTDAASSLFLEGFFPGREAAFRPGRASALDGGGDSSSRFSACVCVFSDRMSFQF
jgi:hypothetical protein